MDRANIGNISMYPLRSAVVAAVGVLGHWWTGDTASIILPPGGTASMGNWQPPARL